MELKLSQYHNIAYRNILYLNSKAVPTKIVAVLGPTSISSVQNPRGTVKMSGKSTTTKVLGLEIDHGDVMIGWR